MKIEFYKWYLHSRNDVYNVFIILQCFVNRSEYAYLHNSFLDKIKYLEKKQNSISINVIQKSWDFQRIGMKTTKTFIH